MTLETATVRRSDALLYAISVVLSVPPLISLIQRQFDVPVAVEIDQFVNGYRSMSDALSEVIHAPLRALAMPPAPPLIDLHVLSFAGMGMMTKGMEQPGEKSSWIGATTWAAMSFALAYLLFGILVFGAILALVIAKPLIAFRSEHYIETTPVLEGPMGRLKRERDMRLERDLARIMLVSLVLTGAYFGLNALLL